MGQSDDSESVPMSSLALGIAGIFEKLRLANTTDAAYSSHKTCAIVAYVLESLAIPFEVFACPLFIDGKTTDLRHYYVVAMGKIVIDIGARHPDADPFTPSTGIRFNDAKWHEAETANSHLLTLGQRYDRDLLPGPGHAQSIVMMNPGWHLDWVRGRRHDRIHIRDRLLYYMETEYPAMPAIRIGDEPPDWHAINVLRLPEVHKNWFRCRAFIDQRLTDLGFAVVPAKTEVSFVISDRVNPYEAEPMPIDELAERIIRRYLNASADIEFEYMKMHTFEDEAAHRYRQVELSRQRFHSDDNNVMA